MDSFSLNIESNQINNSANNDINPSWIRRLNVIVWDRLASTSAWTDTSNYFFLLDSKWAKETLQAKFAQRPMLMAPETVYENKNWEYSLDFYYSLWRWFAPYVRGSKGDNS